MQSACRSTSVLTGSAALALALALSITRPAGAQTALTPAPDINAAPSGTQLGEIVVTARKRPEALQKIPESITSLDANQLAAAHANRIDDLGTLVPNLNIVTRADNSPDVVIRGVGAFGVTPGLGFYVNDVPQFEGQTVRPEDIARIDVLKGPQGTLYGGNNIGGAIKYTTNAPTSDLHGQFAVEGGSFNDVTISGVLSGPLANGVDARVSAFATRNDGFTYDPTLNTTLGGEREQGGRLTLRYTGANTTVNFYMFGDHLRSSYENLYYAPPDDQTYSLQVTANVHPFYHRDIWAPSMVIDHDFDSGVRFTSITSYFNATTKADTDGDHRAVPIFDVFQTLNTKVVTQELRLTSPSKQRFKWLVGLYGQRQNQYFDEQNHFDFSAITDNPDDTGIQYTATNHVKDQLAGFGDGTFSIGAFDLEAGLRIQYFSNRLFDLLAVTKATAADTVFLPKGSITYHLNGDVIGYGSIAAGIEPADNIAENAGTSSYRSENTLNYELGVKSTLFDRRVRLNGGIFYITYDNRLFSTIDGATLQGITRNVGPSYNYGLELDATVRATHEITITGSLGLTRTKWRHAIVFDPTLNATVDLNGLSAPFTPQYQASISGDWRHEIGSSVIIGLHTNASFTGQQWWDITDHYQQRPYDLVSFGASVEHGHWSLSANLKNAFDTRYNTIFAAAEEIGAPFNTAGIGRPREFFVTLGFKN